DLLAVGHLDLASGEIVADEQFIDDELNFLGVQVDVSAPPALEVKIALGLGVDLGIDIVLFGPERIRGVLVLEVLHKPGAIELAGTKIARERREPASAQ